MAQHLPKVNHSRYFVDGLINGQTTSFFLIQLKHYQRVVIKQEPVQEHT